MTVDSKGVVSSLLKWEGDSRTLCIAGVLMRGHELFEPIVDVLPGRVSAYHSVGRKFYVNNLIDDVVRDMNEAARYGLPIQIVGASLGGTLTPFIVERFRWLNPGYDMSSMRIVLVDAPTGVETLTDPMAPALSFAPVASFVGGVAAPFPFFGFMAVPPKPEEITATENVAEKRRIINEAKQHLSGHSLSLLLRQTRWIVKVGQDGTLAHATESLDGASVTYVCCRLGQSPVKQPEAAEQWREWLPNMAELSIGATHCGFKQNSPEYSHMFTHVFAA